ncbi:MAG: hypothetical protein OEV44_14970 [Spirochaetota bacterium]|nr:hypothetical protein [Spirochaetota bacterium]
MSTYYYFECKECNKVGKGIFTRQAWGWGNADIIDCFQFIMKHSAQCGSENISIKSEYDFEDEGRIPETDNAEDLNDYFPYSEDWGSKESDRRLKIVKDYQSKMMEIYKLKNG